MLNPNSLLRFLVGLVCLCGTAFQLDAAERPNIVWIVVEDASPHIGCYGETTIETPHLDALAAGGVKFTNAVITCPVCSPSRSAMVTGMYQTTLGAHNHRSQNRTGKSGGNAAFFESYTLPGEVKMIPQLLKDAGYYTTLGAGPACKKMGKTDYNFEFDRSVYDGPDWRKCPDGKPFFAQIMLHGGKNRRAKQHRTDPDDVKLPPYYPDHPVLREDWADYLNSWVQVDVEVGEIMQDLEEAGVAEETVVFFWTDHGVSHLRGKQFLYEEGIHIPLIVSFGDGRLAGSVRDDLVVHIDVAASSLALGGVEIPENVQGVDLFAADYEPRERVIAARDRCDETFDITRAVRTKRFKYIRNFVTYRPHAQENQYKDGKKIVQTIRALHAAGKLNELQDRVFQPRRPKEELYDLEADPFETVNLAGDPRYSETLKELRTELYDWMVETRDLGLIPEAILEEEGRRHKNKYYVLQQSGGQARSRLLIELFDQGEAGDVQAMYRHIQSEDPAVRYWAATWLGVIGERQGANKRMLGLLTKRAREDESHPVRVACALALCKIGRPDRGVPTLAGLISDENLLTGLDAIRSLEFAGLEDARAAKKEIAAARQSRYEFTRRIARRLTGRLGE